jgi:hypothetical protein
LALWPQRDTGGPQPAVGGPLTDPVALADLGGAEPFGLVQPAKLVMARALEALALLNIMLQIRNNWPWQAGFKLVGPTP